MKNNYDKIYYDITKLDMPIIKELGLVRSRKASSLPWHTNSGYELTFAYSGEFIWEVDKGSHRELLQLTGGVLGLTPPKTLHRGYDSLIAPGQLLFIVFDPLDKNAEKGLSLNKEELLHFSQLWQRIERGTAPVDSQTKSSCNLLASLLKNSLSDKVGLLAICAIRTAILQVLLSALTCFLDPIEMKDNAAIRLACKFMEENYSENLSIDEIARSAGFGKSRFYELFTQEMGQSPGDYFSQIRCRKALALLRETKLSVTDISFDCGYSSSQYFAAIVRKYTGYSPMQYRQHISDKTGIKSSYGKRIPPSPNSGRLSI